MYGNWCETCVPTPDHNKQDEVIDQDQDGVGPLISDFQDRGKAVLLNCLCILYVSMLCSHWYRNEQGQ